MSDPQNHKVVVIGAGPCGAVVSMFLSKNKINHLLIDKAVFPRDKVCGESFVGNIFEVLDEIDPEIKTDLYAKNIVKHASELSFYTHDKRRFVFKIPQSKAPKIQARRVPFDDYLVRYASQSEYCEFIEGVAVKQASKISNGVQLTLSNKFVINSKVAVFANGGVGNLVSNFRGKEFEVKGKQFLFARGVFNNAVKVNKDSAIDFALLNKPYRHGTYLTYLPDGRVTLGLMVEEELVKENKDIKIPDLFKSTIQNHPYLNEVLKKADLDEPLKTTSLKLGAFKKKFADDNYLIAGDAAVPLNPVTGMGVMMAMYYARNAAKAVVKAVESENYSYSSFKAYDQHCLKKYKSEFRKSNLYTYLQTNQFKFFNWVVRRLNNKPKLARFINRLCFGK